MASDRHRCPVIARIFQAAALGGVAALPLLVAPSVGDPFQAPRALAAAVMVAIICGCSPIGGSRRGLPHTPLAVLLLFLGWYALSAAVNHPASSVWGVHGRFQGLVSTLVCGCAAIAGAHLSGRSFIVFGRALAGVVAVEAIVMTAAAAIGGEPVGTFGNRALAAAWLAVAILVAMTVATIDRGPWSMVVLGAAALGAIALGVTGTRGAWVGLTVGGLAGALVIGARVTRARRIYAGIAALVLAGVLLAGAPVLSKLTVRGLSGGSTVSRIEIWKGAARLVAHEPLTGVGPGRFLYEFPRVQSIRHVRTEGVDVRPDQTHNVVLHTAAEAGLPAAFAYVALAGLGLWSATRRARAGDADAAIALTGLAGYLGQALFGVASVETDVVGWLLMGSALASGPAVPGARARAQRSLVPLLGACAAVMAFVLLVSYMRADSWYRRALDAFAAARFETSGRYAERAVALDPLTDVYRVALADAALYAGRMDARKALDFVRAGLALEPRSYDLALARARLLRSSGAAPAATAAAYAEAAGMYPLGVEVRREAIEAFVRAGWTGPARAMAAELMRIVPDDPVATEVLR